MSNQDGGQQAATTGADPVERSKALTKFDEQTLKNIQPAAAGVQRAVFLPANFAEALEMSKMLASGIGVREWCRGNVSACMMIVQQAVRWGLDPYAVANKSYFVNDQVAFESQLVNAVVNTSRQIVGRLRIGWEGEGERLVCTVSGIVAADEDAGPVYLEQKLSDIPSGGRKSPLWKINTKQQIGYFTTRAWARLYVPEVLLGIYTPDEIADTATGEFEAKTLPGTAPAPDRRQFDDSHAEDAEVAEITDQNGPDTTKAVVGPEKGSESPQTDPKPTPKAEKEPEMDLEATVPAPELPANDEEWGMWERDQYAEMTECKDVDALNKMRSESQPVFQHAPVEIQRRVSEAFTDNVVDLTGK